MNARRVVVIVAALLVVGAAGVKAFVMRTPPPPNGVEPPTGPPPFRHWDLREFNACTVPYSFRDGTADIAGTEEFDEVDASFGRWEAVDPALIRFSRVLPAAGALCPYQADGHNLLGWNGFGCPGPGDDVCIPAGGCTCGAAIAANAAIVGPGADTILSTIPNACQGGGDDVIMAGQIVDGGNGLIETVPNALDPSTLGETFVTYLTNASGRIQEADILFNDISWDWRKTADQAATPTGAEVQTVATHEIGHFIGFGHVPAGPDADNAPFGNFKGPEDVDVNNDGILDTPIMDSPTRTALHHLSQDDIAGANFLYTPDLGDAPDPGTNSYQTLVHGTVNSRVLNGINLKAPLLGPVHLFGSPPNRYEWLGVDDDGSNQECEARVTDKDLFDDGVTFPARLLPGGPNRITVRVRTNDPGGRYDNTDAAKRLYFNGYFDFNGNKLFDAAERVVFWSGVPGATSANSPNFVPGASNLGVNPMVLAFDVQPPNLIPASFYVRARLDFGEDEGRVVAGGTNGDLGPATGVAQFGETEDYLAPVLHHFECYETHRPPFDLAGVALVDQFGASTVTMKRAKRLCAPANKNGEDPAAPTDPAHLTAYTIKQTSPKFTRIRGVTVTNQFGPLVVDVVKPERLLVPAAKSLSGTPPTLPNPTDHYKCYRVKGKFRRAGLTVETQFGPLVVDIKRPLHLCAPVDKNGEGVMDTITHLMCYQVRAPKPQMPTGVVTANQFGPPDSFSIYGVRELCVPSTKTLPPP